MQRIYEVETGLLRLMTKTEREAFLERGRRKHFSRGESIFLQGTRGDYVVALLSGRVKISVLHEDGSEVMLAIRGPGELVGELSALDDEPRSATATALEPVEAVLLRSERFRELLESYPRLALILLRGLSRRLRESTGRRVEYGAFDTTGRVAARLVELAEQYGQPAARGVAIRLPISQQELADWVGASREAVSKALSGLRARGWVETGRMQVVIRDLDSLRRRTI